MSQDMMESMANELQMESLFKNAKAVTAISKMHNIFFDETNKTISNIFNT